MKMSQKEEDKLFDLMKDLDLDGAVNYMEEVTDKYKEMEQREARD